MRIVRKYITLSFLFLHLGLQKPYAQANLIDFESIPKDGTILVYSHLDDDLIWMLPFWKITEKFIGGAMPTAPRYNTIIHQQQIYLDNHDYDIDYEENWITPWDPISDSQYTEYYWANNPSFSYLVSDHIEYRSHLDRVQMPVREINKVKAKLEQYFADPDMERVVTHNNWGEYGHAHHQAINKAARELAVKYRKDLWMLGCDNGVFRDINVPSGIPYTIADFDDISLYLGIRDIYERYGRWTWNTDADRIPSGGHKFIKIVDRGIDRTNILTGETVTKPGSYQDEPGSFIFDGSDDYMTLKGNQSPQFTISLRVRPARIREMDIAAMSEHPFSGKNDRNLYINEAGNIVARIFDGNSRTVTSSARVASGEWCHIVLTGDGSTMKLFVNGLPDKTLATGHAITNYSTPEFVLGQATVTDNYFAGQINDVRLYTRALSEREIANLSGFTYRVTATAGNGGTISPSGQVALIPGSDATFSIRPGSGYSISDVRVDDNSIGARSSYTFNDISDNHTISATFRRTSVSIDTEAGEGGNINPEGTVDVDYESDITFTITPETGYHISDVEIDGVSQGSISSYMFSNVTSDHSINAEFRINTYTITASSSPGGTLSIRDLTIVTHGSDLTCSIDPDEGYRVADVRVDGESIGAVDSYVFSAIASNHSIMVEFKLRTYTISVAFGTGGSVSQPSNTVLHGDDQVITIKPDEGYRIEDVEVDGESAGKVPEYIFENVTSDHSISVSFRRIYSVTASAGEGGSVTPSGTFIIPEDSLFTVRVIPGRGYRILDVRVDNKSFQDIDEYTLSDVRSDHNITAFFTDQVDISVFPNPFRDHFTLMIKSPSDFSFEIYVLTLTNKIVYRNDKISGSTLEEIYLNSNPGIYFLKVYREKKSISTIKLIRR